MLRTVCSKNMIGDGGRRHMRYPHPRNEIIRLVERSTSASVRRWQSSAFQRPHSMKAHRYLPSYRGWFYLSTILDDYSRYIIAWKLCTTMKTKDVTDTLKLRCRHQVLTVPRSCINRGCSAITARPISPRPSAVVGRYKWITCGALQPSTDPGQDRALASNA